MALFQQESGQLLSLSDELLVEIMSNIFSGTDLMSCSRTCTRLARLVQDKRVLKNVTFRREVSITAENFKQFFLHPTTCSNIQGINLSHNYWLNPSLIISNLVKMRNLVRLEMADVKISSKQFARIIYKLTKLKTLSFTWSWTSVPEAEEVSEPSLVKRLSELTSLSIYISTSDISPLDKITWMLQYCAGLKHLAIFTEFLHKDVSYSFHRFNITVRILEMRFPVLKSLILDMRNRTFPILLEREFLAKIFAAITPANITQFWCSSYVKREFISKSIGSLDVVTVSMKQPEIHQESEPILATQASFSFSCEKEIFHYLTSPWPRLKKLSLHHLKPCSCPCSRSTSELLAMLMTKIPSLLEGLNELSFSTNGFNRRVFAPKELHVGKILATIKFQNLTKLALPLCGFLVSQEKGKTNSISPGVGSRRDSHWNKKYQNYCSSGFVTFANNVPCLEHLEIVSCQEDLCTNVGAEDILAHVTKLSKLNTLILVRLKVNFGIKSLFQEMFRSCVMLNHLHINSLNCDPQKFCRDLSHGLKEAGNLQILKVFQKQWTQFSKYLFSSISKSCSKLEQLILIDSSKAFTLKKFPVEELLEVANKDSLIYLYVTSELFTLENIKELKSHTKKITAKKPFFMGRFVKGFFFDKYAFYQLADLEKLPMSFKRAVVTINSISTSYCSNSSVANLTVDDVF